MSQQTNDIEDFHEPVQEAASQSSSVGLELTTDEIRMAYRLFLSREPESENVVEAWRSKTRDELRRSFLNSPEFRRNHPEIFAPSGFLPIYMQENAAWRIARIDAHPLVRHHALEIVLFGYTVIRGSFS